MPVLAVSQRTRLTHFEHFNIGPFSAHRAIEQWNVSIVVRERHGELSLSHCAPRSMRNLATAYFIFAPLSIPENWQANVPK